MRGRKCHHGEFCRTVRDSSGGGVPDAAVNILNVQTGFTLDVRTNTTGVFLFPRLPVGTYILRVEKQGFSAYVQDQIALTVDQSANLSITLQIGQLSDEVTVTGAAELVPMRTATGGQLIGEQQIVELPLQGRRPERLMYLAAGTVDLGRNACRICGQGGVYPGEETAGVNGTGQGQVKFQLDATSHNDTYLNTSLPFPNPDAVQEFNLQSSNFTAEYGNAGGGIVNVVVKSGTNDIHGTAFQLSSRRPLERAPVLRGDEGYAEAESVRRQRGRTDSEEQALLFRHLSGNAHQQHAGRDRVVRADRGAASRRLLEHPDTAHRSGHPAAARQQPDSCQSDQPGRAVLPEIHSAAQRRERAADVPRPAERENRQPGDGQNGLRPRQASVQRPIFLHRLRRAGHVIPSDNLLAASNQARAVRVQNVSINHTFTGSPTLLFSSTFGMGVSAADRCRRRRSA